MQVCLYRDITSFRDCFLKMFFVFIIRHCQQTMTKYFTALAQRLEFCRTGRESLRIWGRALIVHCFSGQQKWAEFYVLQNVIHLYKVIDRYP